MWLLHFAGGLILGWISERLMPRSSLLRGLVVLFCVVGVAGSGRALGSPEVAALGISLAIGFAWGWAWRDTANR
jgi:hypothetical protein